MDVEDGRLSSTGRQLDLEAGRCGTPTRSTLHCAPAATAQMAAGMWCVMVSVSGVLLAGLELTLLRVDAVPRTQPSRGPTGPLAASR